MDLISQELVAFVAILFLIAFGISLTKDGVVALREDWESVGGYNVKWGVVIGPLICAFGIFAAIKLFFT